MAKPTASRSVNSTEWPPHSSTPISWRRKLGRALSALGLGGLRLGGRGFLRGARFAGGFALGGALALEVELVARRARAEDEPEEHADHQRARDEQNVARRHLASLVAASRSRRS